MAAASDEWFCGLDRDKAEELFGLETYLLEYGRCADQSADLTLPEPMQELKEWKLRVEFTAEPLDILCCPEDRDCSVPGCLGEGIARCCPRCRMPLCHECETELRRDEPAMPAMSLCNDMMIFDAPLELYTMDVTVME